MCLTVGGVLCRQRCVEDYWTCYFWASAHPSDATHLQNTLLLTQEFLPLYDLPCLSCIIVAGSLYDRQHRVSGAYTLVKFT